MKKTSDLKMKCVVCESKTNYDFYKLSDKKGYIVAFVPACPGCVPGFNKELKKWHKCLSKHLPKD